MAANTPSRRKESQDRRFSDSTRDHTQSRDRSNCGERYIVRLLRHNLSAVLCRSPICCSNYPELSPIVYGGGQSRASYRGHGMYIAPMYSFGIPLTRHISQNLSRYVFQPGLLHCPRILIKFRHLARRRNSRFSHSNH